MGLFNTTLGKRCVRCSLVLVLIWLGAAALAAQDLEPAAEEAMYSLLSHRLGYLPPGTLGECPCAPPLVRDLNAPAEQSARYAFDRRVHQQAWEAFADKPRLQILFFGAGTLLNELTTASYLLASGKDLDLYLYDDFYVFYQQPDFEDEVERLAADQSLVPAGWKDNLFWDEYWNKDKSQPDAAAIIAAARRYEHKIAAFMEVIGAVAEHYGRELQVHVLKMPPTTRLKLPALDLILAIDAFLDLPNLLWQLTYRLELQQKHPLRFVTLHKARPFGGFWQHWEHAAAAGAPTVTLAAFTISSQGTQQSFEELTTVTWKQEHATD